MEKNQVDEGKSFDFGKTSADYAKFRDIYPKELYDKLYSLGIGKNGTTWLDLGTGTGVIPRGLASHGAKITGVDISPEQIAQAELLSKDFENINYKVSKAEDLDFPENYFDAITAVQCFWYFEPNVIVPKIKSIIKKRRNIFESLHGLAERRSNSRRFTGSCKRIESDLDEWLACHSGFDNSLF